MEDPGAEAHHNVIGGSGIGSGDINMGKSGIQAVMYTVKDFLLVTSDRV